MNSADLVASLREPVWEITKDGMEPVIEIWRADMATAADRIEALEAWETEAMEALRQVRLQDRVTRHRGTEQQFYEDGPCGKIARRLVEKEDGHG